MTNGKSATSASSGRKRAESTGSERSKPASKKAAEAPKKTAATPARRETSRSEAVDRVTAVTAEERHALVARAAYFRAESRGFSAGRELEDWVAAEAEVNAQLAAAPQAAERR